jgi:hypothetical protein
MCMDFAVDREDLGIKLDFDLAAMGHSDKTADLAVRRFARQLALPSEHYLAALAVASGGSRSSIAHCPALAGLGVDGSGVRLNVYICLDLPYAAGA